MEASCPSCGKPLQELDESQWPAEGPVPEGTLGVFQCEGNHRVIVAEPQIQA
ncbi:hypothetical protein IWX75_001580 [Arthrobacter sp. CAN_A6]|uniref:hypothetical protein n=1 Tax=unclassified Arthrobacter TaxID=235627 RepID=UPI0018CA34DA